MNVLAIDFSGKLASVAVLSDGQVLASVTSKSLQQNGPESSCIRKGAGKPVGVSSLLTPLIRAAIDQSGLTPSDFRFVALPVGPGLFTGLRVGVVTAKTLAYASGADVVGVNTLEVLAAKAIDANGPHDGPVRVAINAQRQQLFAGEFRSTGTWRVEQVGENQIVDQEVWLESWADGDLVSGSGLKLVHSNLESVERTACHVLMADQTVWDCDAVSVAKVAIEHYADGRRDDYWKMKPLYFRPSAAEEVRLAKLQSNQPNLNE
jgi:tRNA threonylcarbamoyladenosine biosynthesis protein TsaB